jgi:hypothetical protein
LWKQLRLQFKRLIFANVRYWAETDFDAGAVVDEQLRGGHVLALDGQQQLVSFR